MMAPRRHKRCKATDSRWIDEIPTHWQVVRLKYLLDRNGVKIGPFGSALKYENIRNNGIKIYGQEHVIRDDFTLGNKYIDDNKFLELSSYEIRPGDVVVTMMGTTGRCKVVPDGIAKGIMDSHLTRLRVNSEVYLPELLASIINDSIFISIQVKWFSKGSIMDGLNSTIIKSLEIPVPPITEQESILRYLTVKRRSIDETIRKKQRLIELLQEERTVLINQAVTKGLDPQAPMKDSGVEWLGKIPRHWEVKKLKHLASKVLTGSTPPSEESSFYEDGDKNWYSPVDFTDDFTLGSSRRKITNGAITNGVKVYPPMSVLLVGIGATLGKSSICLEECSSNQQVNAVIFNDHLNPWYGLFFLRTVQPVLKQLANTATLAILNQSQMKDILVTVPPLLEQAAIIYFIKERDAEISLAIKQSDDMIALLSEYRASLINEVVTGKRCVLPEEELEKLTKDQELVP